MAAPECSDPLREEYPHRLVAFMAGISGIALASSLFTHSPPSSSNCLGITGFFLAIGTTLLLGVGAWSLPLLLGLYARATYLQRHPMPIFTVVRDLAVVVAMCTGMHLCAPHALPYGQPPGGLVGLVLGELLRTLVGVWGVALLCTAVLAWHLLRSSSQEAPVFIEQTDNLLPEQEQDPLLPAPAHDGGQGAALIDALAYQGITGRVAAVLRGPLITTYEVQVDRGTKLSRNLDANLALSLGRAAVRIVSPLPGKPFTVGFELPNNERAGVSLRSVLSNPRWKAQRGLPLALGVDPTGAPVYVDLESMPHLLVAGGTGSGKSVGLHVMLASLLRCSAEVRLVLIDPKKVEFSAYRKLPHLAMPVVIDVKNHAGRALRWVVDEMERRQATFEQADVRDIAGYHASGARMARLAVMIDEYQAIAAEADIAELVACIAAQARHVGIHLIVATQRPSADVITGVIKANFPVRIAYKVASRGDSQVILDRPGAESLLGQGDLLMLRNGNVARVHGAFISESETRALCEQLRARGEPAYETELDDEPLADTATSSSVRPIVDDAYERACAVVRRVGYASASLLQRELSIGYPKAAKLVERMERTGLVSSADETNGGKRALLDD
jgi:DNA translocase FtsK/SpoIIIE-like protein